MVQEVDRTAVHKPSINPLNGRPFSARYYQLLQRRRLLPVWTQKEELLQDLHRNQVIIIAGEAGSGTSTQIPQFLLQAVGFGHDSMVACTHPSRVGAMSVCLRVTEEMDASIGDEIGYRIPFEDCTNQGTVLKFLTDGVLLREAMADPLLKHYRVVIIDEAHVFSQEAEVLCCAVLQNALKQRPELKLVIMSAKHDASTFRLHFTNSVMMKVPDRNYTVGIYYAPGPVETYVEAAIATAIGIHRWEPPGAIIVFLTAQEDVQYACWKISKKLNKLRQSLEEIGPVDIVPIYSALSLEMQKKVFEPPQIIWKVGAPPVRKIFVSTGVAEASLALEGIVYVIDSGLYNRKIWNNVTWAEKHMLVPIPKARAKRRAALAGGTELGRCYSLYTQQDYNHLRQDVYPESDTRNLGNTILILKNLGVSNLKEGFLDPPPIRQSLESALNGLRYLGALNENENLSSLGETMCEFPLDIQMTKMIFASVTFSCSSEILSISAMLSVPNCFIRPMEAARAADKAKEQFMHVDGDHLTLLDVYNSYIENGQDAEWCEENFINANVMKLAHNIREQLASVMIRFNLKLSSPSTISPWYNNNIKMSILSGYFMQLAHKESSGVYRTVKDNQIVRLDAFTSLKHNHEWIIYHEFHTSRICTATDVTTAMLLEVAHDYYDVSRLPPGEAKASLERYLLLWLRESNPRYLRSFEPHELQLMLRGFPWDKLVPVRVAPPEMEPAMDENGTGLPE